MGIIWVNYLIVVGMIAVGLGAMALWYILKRPKPRYFLYGACLWAIAIGAKYAMDYTISGPFQTMVYMSVSLLTFYVIMSLYVGLRTGLFESGFTYLVVKYTGLSRMDFNETVALGIGFGGIEAIFLGVQAINSINQVVVPLDTIHILLPIWERFFTLFCHVFATVLVVYAVKLKDLRWLLISIVFKTVIDGAIPMFSYFYRYETIFGPGMNYTYAIESYVAMMGIISILGLYRIAKKYGGGIPDAPKAGNADPGN